MTVKLIIMKKKAQHTCSQKSQDKVSQVIEITTDSQLLQNRSQIQWIRGLFVFDQIEYLFMSQLLWILGQILLYQLSFLLHNTVHHFEDSHDKAVQTWLLSRSSISTKLESSQYPRFRKDMNGFESSLQVTVITDGYVSYIHGIPEAYSYQ